MPLVVFLIIVFASLFEGIHDSNLFDVFDSIQNKRKKQKEIVNEQTGTIFMEYPLQCTFAKLKNIINILYIAIRLFNKAF